MAYDSNTDQLIEGTTPASRVPATVRAPSLSDNPVHQFPDGYEALAGGFPRYADALDDLDDKAYIRIRRCPETAQPINKFALLLSTWNLTVKGQDEYVPRCQDIIDSIPHLRAAIRRFAWALIEGVRFGWMQAHVKNGLVIPSITVHAKYRAGGWIMWDGAHVVRVQRPYHPGADSLEETEARKLPRDRVVVFAPHGHPSPEGDQDLAWQLYLLCEEADVLRENRRHYAERHGMPREILRRATEKATPESARSVRSAAAKKMETSNRQGLVAGLEDILQFVEPGGSSWQYLLEASADIRKTAHILVLQQALTTETSSSGPTGSSKVQESEEWLAISAIADSVSEAFTADLLPFILRHNRHVIPPGYGNDWALSLEPPADTAEDVSGSDALALADKHPVNADWLYDVFGAPRPATVPDIIEPPEQQPFSGFGGFGGGFGLAATQKDRAHLSARADDRRESLATKAETELAKVIDESLEQIVSGDGVGNDFAEALAELMATAHLEGARQLRETIPPRALARLAAIEGRDPLVKLDAAATISRVAELYRGFAARAKLAANDTLRERVHNRLTEFVEAGGEDGDTAALVRELRTVPSRDGGTLSRSYARLVARNATMTAYSAGQLDEYDRLAVRLGMPWAYDTAGDQAVRPEHRIYDGLVFPPDPQYRKFIPPNDHNCRCTWRVVDIDTPTTALDKLRRLPAPAWDYPPGEISAAQLRAAGDRFIARLQHEGTRWITIGKGESEDSKGRPVLIDGEGNIVGGAVPRSMHGKPVSDPATYHSGRETGQQQQGQQQEKPKTKSPEYTVESPTFDADVHVVADMLASSPSSGSVGSYVEIPQVYDELKKRYKDLTIEQFHSKLWDLRKSGEISFTNANSPGNVARPDVGFWDRNKLIYWVRTHLPQREIWRRQDAAAAKLSSWITIGKGEEAIRELVSIRSYEKRMSDSEGLFKSDDEKQGDKTSDADNDTNND